MANVTGMRSLAGMDGLHVPLEVVAAAEVLRTEVTHMRLDSCVGRYVTLEVDIFGKVLTTRRTRKGPCTFVASHVHFQGTVTGKWMPAIVTGKGRVRAGVQTHVTKKMGPSAVSLVAGTTGKAIL